MPIVKEKAQVKEQLRLASDEIVKAYPPHEWDYILFNTGLGESVIFFYWMKEYKKINPRKLLVLCYDESRASLLEESPYIDATVTIPPILVGYINVYLTKQYNNIKNFLLIHLLPLGEGSYINKFGNEILHNDEGVYTGLIRSWLGIESDKKLEKYPVNISPSKVEKAKKLFEEFKLREGRTVFIVADGYTIDTLRSGKKDFWTKLIKKLRSLGYDVVTKGTTEMVSGCKCVFLPPWETTVFAGLCGNVISIGSGIIFAVSFLNNWNHINIQSLLPDEWDSSWRNNWLNWDNYIMTFVMRKGRHFINEVINWGVSDFAPLQSDNILIRYIVAHKWDDEFIDQLVENLQKDEKNQK